MQRIAVPAKLSTAGCARRAGVRAGGRDLVHRRGLESESYSGAPLDPTAPDATVVTSAPATSTPRRSRQAPLSVCGPEPPAVQGLTLLAGPMPAMQQPSGSRSAKSAEVSSVVKSSIRGKLTIGRSSPDRTRNPYRHSEKCRTRWSETNRQMLWSRGRRRPAPVGLRQVHCTPIRRPWRTRQGAARNSTASSFATSVTSKRPAVESSGRCRTRSGRTSS